jgi:uncharacterized coiled-coil protein SlyX
MEITGPAISALFVGLIWTLIKVVEFFISKKNNSSKNSMIMLQEQKFNEMYDIFKEISKFGPLTREQMRLLENIQRTLEDLQELHIVYDENHVPKWYVPSELLPLVRQVHVQINAMCKEIEDNLENIESGQESIITKMLDLITTQKIMIEKLGDLINSLK